LRLGHSFGMALFYAYFRLSVHIQKPWNVQFDSPETPPPRAKPNTPRKLSYNICVVLPFVLLLFFPQSIALYVEFVL
uniref:hypothetical protein n=1 Tax=Gemmiger formicilis TaxID=745368 RepID=UPI004027C10C